MSGAIILELVPSAQARERRVEECTRSGGCLLNRRVLTAGELLERLADAGMGVRPRAPAGVLRAVLWCAIRRVRGLHRRSPLALATVRSSIPELLVEIGRNRLSQKDLLSAGTGHDGRTLRLVAEIHREVGEILDRLSVADFEGQLEALAAGDPPDLTRLFGPIAGIRVHGAMQTDPLGRAFLKQLAKVASLRTGGGGDDDWDMVPTSALEKLSAAAEVDEDGFPIAGGRLPVDESVRVRMCTGVVAQAEETARLLRASLDKGVPPERMAVVFRDPGLHLPLLEEACARRGVRVEAPPATFRRLGAGAQLGFALEIPFGGWRRADILGLLPAGARRGELERLLDAALVRDLAPDGDWRLRLTELAKRKPERFGDRIAPALACLEPLLSALEALSRPQTAAAFLSQCLSLHVLLGNRPAAGLPDFLRAAARVPEAALCEDVLELVELKDFLRFLLDAVPEEAGLSAGAVAVLAPPLGGLAFDHLILGGLVEGEFPSASRPSLLSDRDRKLLNRRLAASGGEGRLPLAAAGRVAEGDLFGRVLSAARKSITLLAPRQDARGRDVVRSRFLDGVLVRFGDDALAALAPAAAECQTPVELVVNSLTGLAAGGGVAAVAPAVAGAPALLERALHGAAVERARELFFMGAAPAGPYNGGLRDLAALPDRDARARDPVLARLAALFDCGAASHLSATTLEAYGKCPFHFFMGKALQLEAPLAFRDELERREEGILIHAVLERAFLDLAAAARERGQSLVVQDDAGTRAVVERAATAVFASWERNHDVGHPDLWRIHQEQVRTVLSRILAYEARSAEWEPHLFELEFGARRGTPGAADPVSLAAPWGGEIFLRGKIDRIDLGPDGFRIVDYKNTTSPASYRAQLKDEAIGVTNFQMPVYLVAAQQYLRKLYPERRLDRVQVLYYGVKGPETVSASAEAIVLSGDFLRLEPAADRRTLAGQLHSTLERFLRGRFPVSPRDCRNCDFTGVCRYQAAGVKVDE